MKIRKTSNRLAIKCLFSAIFPLDDFELSRNAVSWILYDNDIPAGFCSVKKLTNENGAFMELAGILPRYRGKGLHKRLIKVRIAWAKRMGLDYMLTYTVMDNQASFDNLQDLGFRLYNPDYRYAGKQHYWIKHLT